MTKRLFIVLLVFTASILGTLGCDAESFAPNARHRFTYIRDERPKTPICYAYLTEVYPSLSAVDCDNVDHLITSVIPKTPKK